MTAGIDKFTPASEEQKLFDEVFHPDITEEPDIDVKESELQRGSFSLSVALDSLKKWACGRREKHSKPFGLTNNSAVEKLEAAGEELGLPETDVRLSSGLKLLMGLMHGKKEVEIIGEDILIEAAKKAKEKGKGSVIAPTHFNGEDVPTASYLASLLNKINIGVASTNRDWIKKGVGGINLEAIQYLAFGAKNFFGVPYEWVDKKSKKPVHFSTDHYEEAVKFVEDGGSLVLAGYSADDSVGPKPRSEMGSAAIHTALKSGADLIFVYVSSEDKKLTIRIMEDEDGMFAAFSNSYRKALEMKDSDASKRLSSSCKEYLKDSEIGRIIAEEYKRRSDKNKIQRTAPKS